MNILIATEKNMVTISHGADEEYLKHITREEFLFLVIGLILIIIQVLKDRKEYKEHLMNKKS